MGPLGDILSSPVHKASNSTRSYPYAMASQLPSILVNSRGCESPGTGQGSQELCPRQPGQKGCVVFLALLPPMTVSTEPTAKVFRVAGVVNFKSVTSNETVIKRSCPLHLRMP